MTDGSIHPPNIDRVRKRVSQPARRVELADQRIGGERDIRITHDGTTRAFRVRCYNLTATTREALRQGEPARIALGWKRGGTDRVLDGELTRIDHRRDGGDIVTVVRGRAAGGVAVRQRVTASWRDATPTTITRDLASTIGLDVGWTGTGTGDVAVEMPRLDRFRVRRTKRVRAWLDTLVERAGAATGRVWTWHVDRGRLSVHPTQVLPATAARLTTADEIRGVTPHHSRATPTNNVTPKKLWTFATPALRTDHRLDIAHTRGGKAPQQGGRVPGQPDATDTAGVGTDQPRQYRLARYTIRSGTTTGDHDAEAVVVPRGARYRRTQSQSQSQSQEGQR